MNAPRLTLRQLLAYLTTLEAKLLVISVTALENDMEHHTDAVKNLELLAKKGELHTRDAARAALERHRMRGAA